jgi:hypothetical protein
MEKLFRTIVEVPPTEFWMGYTSPTLIIGSCFAENVGNRLQVRKFPVEVNPFGVVYNPISVKLVLKRIISGEAFAETELDFHNNLWFSFLHHSSFSHSEKQACLNNINQRLLVSQGNWDSTQHLIITFGTARVYFHKRHNKPVSNCHKIAASEFDHRLLTVKEITTIWNSLLEEIISKKPNIKIAFTVSPIRHWKDGAQGNQLSKSILHLAINEMLEAFPKNTFYFPAYEIMLDDLRDYRFYAEDMLHPSDLAVDYIWDKFTTAYISLESYRLMKDIERLVLAHQHRPLHPGTAEHIHFVEKTISEMERFTYLLPTMDFSKEIELMKLSLTKK